MKNAVINLFVVLVCIRAAMAQENVLEHTSDEHRSQTEIEFHGKIGTSYAHELDNWGLDVSLNLYFKIDPYFALGIETDLFWLPWEKKLGQTRLGSITKDVVADTDIYSIPIFFNAQVRLPVVAKYIYIEPFITGGIGWAMAILTYNRPEYVSIFNNHYSRKNITEFYQGFTWQVFLTIAAKPYKESRINFLFDIGYRGLSPQNINNENLDISGLLLKAGVMVRL